MWMHAHSHGRQLVNRAYNFLEDIQPGLAPKVFGGVATSAVVSYVAVRGYRYYCARRTVKERGEAARQACQTLRDHLNERQEEEGPVNKEKEAMIVSLEMAELQQKLQKGELKAVEVLRAYQRKALEVHGMLNCITEPIFEAEALAVELELLPPNQRKPLHGIPVSIKDSIQIEGYDCHAGYSYFANKPAEKDADIVQGLKSLGAVPFVRTNFPQGLMTFACSNPMYGQTKNPHDLKRGPAGSSGGEGALLGGGGSIIGIGSDIGGSIRMPAQFCGVYGLKPTVERMGNRGHMPLGMGQTLVKGALGPMARDLSGLIRVTQALLTPGMHPLDPHVPPLSFKDELFEKKGPLCVGFYTALEGTFSPHPADTRAIMQAKAALESQGHKVVEFQPPRAFEAFSDLFIKTLFADDGKEGFAYLKDDVLDPCISTAYYMKQLPARISYLMGKLIGLVDPPVGQITCSMTAIPKRIIDWWHLQDKIQAYKEEFYKAWQSQKLDALICPGLPYPAITSGQEDNVFWGLVATGLYNLLNYPAGMMPITTVTEEDVRQLRDASVYPVLGSYEKFVVKDSEGSVGLPVGIQCVSLPFHEEMVLRVMKDIERVIKKK